MGAAFAPGPPEGQGGWLAVGTIPPAAPHPRDVSHNVLGVHRVKSALLEGGPDVFLGARQPQRGPREREGQPASL